METKNNFAYNLRLLMLKQRKRGTDIATAMGVAPNSVYAWRQGRAVPEMKTLEKLADYFKVTVPDLLTHKD